MVSVLESSFPKRQVSFLLFSIFLTASCALIYELLIGSVCSYFLGDSVKQFSLVIGIFISSMGVGTYLTRFIKEDLLLHFFKIEIILGTIGGLSIPALYVAFAYTHSFSLLAFVFTFLVGALIGFEIPLVTRELSGCISEQKNISNVLSMDYLGGLCATILFPFVLIPYLGLYRTSLVFGLINISIGIIGFQVFQEALKKNKTPLFTLFASFFFIMLLSSLVMSKKILHLWELSIYKDEVVLSKQSEYQKIVVTANNGDTRLFLNGNLQFSSRDEYRYHESLVHIPMGLAKDRSNVLILGGGDGLAVREVLKYDDVEHITLVDLDKKVTDLSKSNRMILDINQNSLNNSKVKIVNEDAFKFLIDSRDEFSIILADLPDPSNVSLAKLYSKEFYTLISRRLKNTGIYTGQSTSPYYSKDAYWCIMKSISDSGFTDVYPYHVNIPSFGEWGFILASRRRLVLNEFNLTVSTKFLTSEIAHFFHFEKDLKETPLMSSSLDHPIVLTYYLKGWKKFQ